MTAIVDYVVVKSDKGESYRVAIESHWRSLPKDEGFILFKHRICELCGFHVDTVRDLDGARIFSLKSIDTKETIWVLPSNHLSKSKQHGECKEVEQKELNASSVGSTKEKSVVSRQTELETYIDKLVSRLDQLENLVEEKVARIPVAPNLIKNSLMQSLQPCGAPTGYTVNSFKLGGKITCNAVHPYTHGFEGCYTREPPENSVRPKECALAKKGCPVFYGIYNMGPRLTRGGLYTGWHTIRNGHILKLVGNRRDQLETGINLPVLGIGAASKVRFVAWIKCVKGCVMMSVDYRAWNNPGMLFKGKRLPGGCRPQDCAQAPQGWFQLDDVVPISNITKLNGGHSFLLRCFGQPENGGLGDFEIYVALPYITLVEDSKKVTIAPFVSEW